MAKPPSWGSMPVIICSLSVQAAGPQRRRSVSQSDQSGRTIVRRPPFYEMRHSEPGAPFLWKEAPDGGWVAPPCVYHRGLEHVGGEGVEAPVVHRRQAQPMVALQGEFPVGLQLKAQVGDGVRRRYPVPRVFQVGAEAQVHAGDSLCVAMAHWRVLTSMPIILRYAATASKPLTNCCSVWATTSRPFI